MTLEQTNVDIVQLEEAGEKLVHNLQMGPRGIENRVLLLGVCYVSSCVLGRMFKRAWVTTYQGGSQALWEGEGGKDSPQPSQTPRVAASRDPEFYAGADDRLKWSEMNVKNIIKQNGRPRDVPTKSTSSSSNFLFISFGLASLALAMSLSQSNITQHKLLGR